MTDAGPMSADDIAKRSETLVREMRSHDIVKAERIRIEQQHLQIQAVCRLVNAIESIDMTLIDIRNNIMTRG